MGKNHVLELGITKIQLTTLLLIFTITIRIYKIETENECYPSII